VSTPLPRAAALASALVPLVAALLPLPANAQPTPAALSHFGTYLGGTEIDRIAAVAQYQSDVIVVGTTRSNSIEAGGTGGARPTGADIFVAHFQDSGALNTDDFGAAAILVFGGDGDDEPTAMFLGPNREVYVVGKTTSTVGSFPTAKRYGTSPAGTNAFVARVGATNTDYDWFMFLSGNLDDVATGVTMAGSNVYVSGWTRSTTFQGMTGLPTGMNGFVTEIVPPSGGVTDPRIGWNLKPTILGGAMDDSFLGITVSAGDKLHVTGTTFSTSFTYGSKVLNLHKGGTSDAWVAQLAVGTGALDWVTFVGGGGADQGNAIAAASSLGVFVVAGTTDSPGNLGSGGPLPETNAFVAWMLPSGALKFSEVRSGSHNDVVQAVTTDSSGNAYVGGKTGSDTFARVGQTGFDRSIEASAGTELREGFVWMAPPEGGDGWSSYVGSDSLDEVTALSLASSDKLIIGMQTSSGSGMPGFANPGSYDTSLGGTTDGYLLSVAAVDTSPPGMGTVFDRPLQDINNVDIDTTTSTSALYANWNGFGDTNTIVKYEWAVGTRANPFVPQPFTSVDVQRSGAATGLSLVVGQEYIVTVRATNTYGLTRTAVSDGVVVTDPNGNVPDAGMDGGMGEPDSGVGVPDGGMPGPDAGMDAGTDGGTTNPPDGGGGGGGGDDEDPDSPVGWGCASGGGAAPLLLLGLFALVLAGRRLRTR
jgi:hypothetical protein